MLHVSPSQTKVEIGKNVDWEAAESTVGAWAGGQGYTKYFLSTSGNFLSSNCS